MNTVDKDHIGILGHCWGGRVAWLGACSNPGFKACIIFYGGRVKAAFADNGTPPIQLAGQIAGPVMGVFGNEDQGPSPEDVDAYEAALQQAGVPSDKNPVTLALKPCADMRFGFSGRIDVGRVNEIDAQFHGLVEHLSRLPLVAAAAEIIGAQAHEGNFEARVTELAKLHGCCAPR